ncbi:helix-turn-helix domain-containing protein [Ochrobactrum sp. Marseille-Q0166]|uniref:helix-turn-helix domain-containing protein n=1 Tax=Ochrobactrum sp. Marseille-Q0166 TaxID=2761105 RepID=UPI0016566266|nr:hypothetical protein [Ochrobactrum sp. Marseille-Q0166]
MVVKTIAVTPQALWQIFWQLRHREMTGRGKFREWGIIFGLCEMSLSKNISPGLGRWMHFATSP